MKKAISTLLLLLMIPINVSAGESVVLRGIPVTRNNRGPLKGILVRNAPEQTERIVMGQAIPTNQPKRAILISTPYSSRTSPYSEHNDTAEALLGVALIGGLVALIANADYTSFSYSHHGGHHGSHHYRPYRHHGGHSLSYGGGWCR